MTKLPQKQIIKKYLEDLGEWKREFEIHRIDTKFGFIGPRGERDIRELIATGELEASYDGRYRIVRAKRTNVQKMAEEFIKKYPPRVEIKEEKPRESKQVCLI